MVTMEEHFKRTQHLAQKLEK